MRQGLSREEKIMSMARRNLAKLRSGLPSAWCDDIEGWVEYLRINRGLSASTALNYGKALESYLLHLHRYGHDINGAPPAAVVAWQKALYTSRGISARTRGSWLSAVRQFYRWRILEGLSVSNPAESVTGPKRPKNLPRKYTDAQVGAMLRSCDRSSPSGIRDYALLVMLYTTGLREYEVAQMNMRDLDIRERVGSVRVHGKGAKDRIVSFEKPTVDALRQWFTQRDQLPRLDDPNAVWVNLRGQWAGVRIGQQSVRDAVLRAQKRGRVKVEPGMAVHTWRVTYATDLYDHCKDIERVRLALGHEDINTTRQYIAISKTHATTRLPAQRVREVAGEGGGVPLWLRRKMDERRTQD